MNKPLTAVIAMLLATGAAPVRGAELQVLVKDQHGKLVCDAVVSAIPADPKNALHAKPPQDAVDQVDKQFVPYVKVIYVGSKVRFPNKDNIRHQVYSFSPAKKFELPLYAGSTAPPVLFETPGVVVLGCNIHDWMVGFIYVSSTPFFAKTESAGTAGISDMPPGEYEVRIWQPGMERSEESTARKVTMSAGTPTRIEWQLAVKATYRVPRVSGPGAAGY